MVDPPVVLNGAEPKLGTAGVLAKEFGVPQRVRTVHHRVDNPVTQTSNWDKSLI
jgi:hypothetical protein